MHKTDLWFVDDLSKELPPAVLSQEVLKGRRGISATVTNNY